MTRREFVGGAMAAGGALVFEASAGAAQNTHGIRAIGDKAPLGRTGIHVSLLGLGTGTVGTGNSSNQTLLGQKAFTRMVRRAYEAGVNYFDAAEWYGSHAYLRKALEGLDRDTYVIESKIWFRRTQDVLPALDRFRTELGTDYIDTVLLHCATRGSWPEDLRPLRDALSEAKQREIIRAHGVSCHGWQPLRAAAELDWVDVILVRINHKGVNMDARPEQVVPLLQKMHDGGKGVTGMKILGEGKLADERDESLRYVLRMPCVDSIVIGFESVAQIDDIVRRIEEIRVE